MKVTEFDGGGQEYRRSGVSGSRSHSDDFAVEILMASTSWYRRDAATAEQCVDRAP